MKAIEFIARDAGLVSYRIKPNLPVLGKRYGKLIPLIRKALEEADGAEVKDGDLAVIDYEGVCDSMRLTSGVLWPLPIALDVTEAFADGI